MVRKDCKFYNPNRNDCSALKELYCAIEEKPCSFFKENLDCENCDCEVKQVLKRGVQE